jgi:predicted alpha/beta-hydrolase family hydrolase
MKSLLTSFLIIIWIGASCQNNLCVGAYWTEREANVMMKKFATEWRDKASWEQRGKVIKQGILDGMQYDKMPDIKGNFNPIIHGKRTMDGYVVENIVIESFPGFYITGNLYYPTEKQEKYAAILCPHGHGNNPRFGEAVQKRCAVLARMGAIVFAYDMIGYGDSQQTEHKMPIALLLQTWNCKRVLVCLLSRPDVDSEWIGMTGVAGGGTPSVGFTAIDDRIKVSVPVVQVSAHFFGGCVCESGMPIHKDDNHQTNNVEIAALCVPRPLLIVSDGGDWTSNVPRVEYPYIRKVYALYDLENRVENVHFPLERHDYGPSKRAAAYNFLAHHLQLSAGRIPYDNGYKEDFVKLLAEADLSVINEKYPLPANALKGNEAVMRYLGL